jgi:dihydrofolate reductase
MRKIINSTYVSLDGQIQEPQHWSMNFWTQDHTDYANDLLFGADALLMGRKTYDVFAEAWPSRPEDDSEMGRFTARMNSIEKYVASTTLKDPSWNNTQVLEADVADAVRELKERPGNNIVMYGAGPVTRELVKHGLLDELHLWVHPVVVGPSGDGPFDGYPNTAFELVSSRPLDSGVVVLVYKPRI